MLIALTLGRSSHTFLNICLIPISSQVLNSDEMYAHVVVVVCPLQPSSSVNSGCPGPESSVLVRGVARGGGGVHMSPGAKVQGRQNEAYKTFTRVKTIVDYVNYL